MLKQYNFPNDLFNDLTIQERQTIILQSATLIVNRLESEKRNDKTQSTWRIEKLQKELDELKGEGKETDGE